MSDLLTAEALAETVRRHSGGIPLFDHEVTALLAHIAALQAQLDALLRGEFICKKCGIRKDGESRKNEVPF